MYSAQLANLHKEALKSNGIIKHVISLPNNGASYCAGSSDAEKCFNLSILMLLTSDPLFDPDDEQLLKFGDLMPSKPILLSIPNTTNDIVKHAFYQVLNHSLMDLIACPAIN